MLFCFTGQRFERHGGIENNSVVTYPGDDRMLFKADEKVDHQLLIFHHVYRRIRQYDLFSVQSLFIFEV
jgi:hypothetical protein